MPLYALGDVRPHLGNNAWVAPNATIIGDVHLGENASVWWNAVLRADTAPIHVGPDANIQDGSILHVDYDTPMHLGKAVTIAHGVMLHGCSIGDNCLIGMCAIILNRAVIGKNCIVGAGTLIPEGKTFPEGVMIMGSPGKIIRELNEKELAYLHYPSTHYVENAARYASCLRQVD